MLIAGSGIKLGLTEEQKDEDVRRELDKRRVSNLNFRMNEDLERMAFLKHKVRTEVEEDKLKNELENIVTGEKPMTANERMLQLAKTNSYIDRFEQILKEREDEDKFNRARHERFENMKAIMGTLKDNLISAAYPRGGGEHLKYSTVIGVPKD